MSPIQAQVTASSDSSFRNPVLAFDTLAFAGFFLLALVLIPVILFKQVPRNRTWFGLILGWMLYSVSYILILGRQFGPAPPFGLCMLQAILIYTMPTMNGWTHLAFVTEVYMDLRMVLFRKQKRSDHVQALVVIPYTMSFVSFIGAFLLLNDPTDVQRNNSHMFCHIKRPGPSTLTGILCAIPVLLALLLESYMTRLLIRHWKTFRRADSRSPVSLSILIRILAFTAVLVAGFGLTVTSFASRVTAVNEMLWDILLLTLPILAALAFGTRRDVMYGWVLWWRRIHSRDSKAVIDNNDTNLEWNSEHILVIQ
ncbi:hypothetical protein C8J56DRAFT_538345 [Mycena floridula]|nr:hypothetical protein C8J56DRAFT_538345 [Mycena floridula]